LIPLDLGKVPVLSSWPCPWLALQLGVEIDPMFRYMKQGFVALQRTVDRFIFSRSSSYNTTLDLTASPFPTLAHTSDSKSAARPACWTRRLPVHRRV